MYCTNCGERLPAGADFCPVCGCRADDPAPAAGAKERIKAEKKQAKAEKKRARAEARARRRLRRAPWLLGTLAVLVLLLTAGAAAWHYLGPRPGEQDFLFSKWELTQAAAAESPAMGIAAEGANGRMGEDNRWIGGDVVRVGDLFMEARYRSFLEDGTPAGVVERYVLGEDWDSTDLSRGNFLTGYYMDLTPFQGDVWYWRLTGNSDKGITYALGIFDLETMVEATGFTPEAGWTPQGRMGQGGGRLWFGLHDENSGESWVCHVEPDGSPVWDFALPEGCEYVSATGSGLYIRQPGVRYDGSATAFFSLYTFDGTNMDILPRGDFSTQLLAEADDGVYLLLDEDLSPALVRADLDTGAVTTVPRDSLEAQGADVGGIRSQLCDTCGSQFYFLTQDEGGTDLYRVDGGDLSVTHLFRDEYPSEGDYAVSFYLVSANACVINYWPSWGGGMFPSYRSF